jgi:GTPase SAR1 family protein|mmetsp:Transcript_118250/g.166223  ORF Transcript_118250/g.166223 Transcript_118250/m.166223 type:complete len:360 (+) Transcript_118250:161-1240(+)
MGTCGSKSGVDREAERLNAEIERRNREEAERESQKIKLLLLGAGESGKSTLFKQFKILYGVGFSDEDRRGWTPQIYNNVITSMKSLVQACVDMDIDVEAEDERDEFEGISDDAPVDEHVGALVRTLWADSGIQEAFEQRHKFQLIDSAAYYFGKIDEIVEPGYVATVEDVLKSRVRTSGIVEETYLIEEVTFVIIDVGGQRNERKKWIHCFDDVTAVIFVAAISEYDQTLYEDASQNRIVEAISLFDEICNSRWFENTSMILFLNKKDLFETKIKVKDICHENEEGDVMFDDYDGGCDYEAGVRYFVQKFLEVNRNPSAREIFYHVTCATDTSNIDTVFGACREIILRDNLKGSGYLEY